MERLILALAALAVGGAACEGPNAPEGPPIPPPGPHFSVSPIPLDKIARITPIGFNNKLFPTAHTYWMTCDDFIVLQGTRPCVTEPLPVLAPGTGTVLRIEHAADGELTIEGPPGLILTFAHVTPEPSLRVGSPVAAGQVVATMFNLHSFDFGVTNYATEHYYVVPERYHHPARFGQNPIAQYPDSLKTLLLTRVNSLSDPLGRLSRDAAGTASGGWFIEGAPRNNVPLEVGNEHMLLWLGRYVEREETRIVGLGEWHDGQGRGGAVDPADPSWEDITPASGIVALRLWPLGLDALPNTTMPGAGTLLIQLLDDVTLRVEWFDTHDPVTAFTTAARIYER